MIVEGSDPAGRPSGRSGDRGPPGPGSSSRTRRSCRPATCATGPGAGRSDDRRPPRDAGGRARPACSSFATTSCTSKRLEIPASRIWASRSSTAARPAELAAEPVRPGRVPGHVLVEGAPPSPATSPATNASMTPRRSAPLGCAIVTPVNGSPRRSGRRRAPRRRDTGRRSGRARPRAAATRNSTRTRSWPSGSATHGTPSPRYRIRTSASNGPPRGGSPAIHEKRSATSPRRSSSSTGPDDHPVRRRIDVDHVPALARRHAGPAPLPDRERERPVVPAEHGRRRGRRRRLRARDGAGSPARTRRRPRRARSRAPASRASSRPGDRTARPARASRPSGARRPGTATGRARAGRACGACTTGPSRDRAPRSSRHPCASSPARRT